MTVTQKDNVVECAGIAPDGKPVKWSIKLDRSETEYRFGEEKRNSAAKWEGSALLINTLVSGPQSYTLMDRWKLSRDHAVLTVERHILRGGSETEEILVYRHEGATPTQVASAPAPAPAPTAPAPGLVTRTEPRPAAPGEPAAPDLVVPAGTRIPLSLRNPLNSKYTRDGDRIYLETVFPVSIDGHIVVPKGSYVTGTVTSSKPAGAVKGTGELYIRFDSLTLPNGVTRDFRSRVGSTDASATGKLDRKEGKITGERDKAGEAKSTAQGAGVGAAVGGIAGAAAGSPMTGLGIGAAAGAAAGLAAALHKHKPDASLPAGSMMDMVLDRDLHFQPADLKNQ